MDAIDMLRIEHGLILQGLELLDEIVRRIERGEEIPRAASSRLIDFFRRFADDCHHAKEEGALFPELEQSEYLTDREPIHALMLDHERGRLMLLALALERLDVEPSRQRFAEIARAYASMSRRHIRVENDVLFVLAERVLDAEQDRVLLSAFATYDRERAGARERYGQVIGELTHDLAL
jgi:hemerythrin-like domain-containing protein